MEIQGVSSKPAGVGASAAARMARIAGAPTTTRRRGGAQGEPSFVAPAAGLGFLFELAPAAPNEPEPFGCFPTKPEVPEGVQTSREEG